MLRTVPLPIACGDREDNASPAFLILPREADGEGDQAQLGGGATRVGALPLFSRALSPYPCHARVGGVRWPRRRAWAGKKLKRAIGQIGAVRLLVALAASSPAASISRATAWDLPLAGARRERALRLALPDSRAERVDQPDDRIVLLVYNDETLRALGQALAPRPSYAGSSAARARRDAPARDRHRHPDRPGSARGRRADQHLPRRCTRPLISRFATHAANPTLRSLTGRNNGSAAFPAPGFGRASLHPASIRLGPDLDRWRGPPLAAPDPRLPFRCSPTR